MQVDETRISFSTRVALLVPSFVNGYVTGKHSDTVPYSPHHLNSSLVKNDISPVPVWSGSPCSIWAERHASHSTGAVWRCRLGPINQFIVAICCGGAPVLRPAVHVRLSHMSHSLERSALVAGLRYFRTRLHICGGQVGVCPTLSIFRTVHLRYNFANRRRRLWCQPSTSLVQEATVCRPTLPQSHFRCRSALLAGVICVPTLV